MPQGSIPAGCTIHVKESALSEYKADEVWSTYELVSDNTTVVPFIGEDGYEIPHYYDLQGRRFDSRPQYNGIFIINGKKTMVTDSRQ